MDMHTAEDLDENDETPLQGNVIDPPDATLSNRQLLHGIYRYTRKLGSAIGDISSEVKLLRQRVMLLERLVFSGVGMVLFSVVGALLYLVVKR